MGSCRPLTLRLFCADAHRHLLVDEAMGVSAVKKMLVKQLYFPQDIKLIGRPRPGSSLVTLKASDELPYDSQILLHGAVTLWPVRPLPPLPAERSTQERCWTYRGVVPRVTSEQALAMCRELRDGFADLAFQSSLRRLRRDLVRRVARQGGERGGA